MANYLDVKNRIQSVSTTLGYNLIVTDKYEVNNQSDNFEIGKIYMLDDVGGMTTEDKMTNGYYIVNGFNKSIWFVKDIAKDDNQNDKDTTYNDLITAINTFIHKFNEGGGKTNYISSWRTTRGQITNNYFLAVNLSCRITTECNR